MSPCPSCGYALDASRPLPPYCPNCGHALHDHAASGVGAPPTFAGNPGESGAATIFVPAESSTTLPRAPLEAPRRRQPPPAPGQGDSGPPSIGLGDMGAHNELDLGVSGSALELSEPPPGVALPEDSGLDLLMPADINEEAPTHEVSPYGTPPGAPHHGHAVPPPPGAPQPFNPPSADPMADLPSPKLTAPAPGRFAPPPGTPPAPPAAPFVPPPADPTADLPSPKLTASAPGRFAPPPGTPPAPPAAPFVPPPADPMADLPSPKLAGPAPGQFAPPVPGSFVPPAADPMADLPGLKHPGHAGPPIGAPPVDPMVDLPQPAAPRPGPPPAAPPLNLPAPVEQARAAFADDLPAPADLDLPGLRDMAGPTPAGVPDVDFDLPIPADLPAPSSQDVRPAEMGMTPAEQDLVPMQMDVEPKLGGDELAPTDLPGPRAPGHDGGFDGGSLELDRGGVPGGGPSPIGQPGPADPIGPAPSTTPAAAAPATTPTAATTKAKRPAVSRGVKLLGGGLLVVGLAGAGVLYSGILDDPPPERAAQRGVPSKSGDGGDGATVAPTPSGAAVDRSAAVLAKFAEHTPSAYQAAATAATEAGDAVGSAEAALLLHYHFGPNLALATKAGTTLGGFQSSQEPFVVRVLGLAALSADNHAGAEQALAGDDPRTRLYRGWLRLDQGKLDEAAAEATAVAAALPKDNAVRELALSIKAQRDPASALPDIIAAAEASPAQLGLLRLQIDTALALGRIADAQAAADRLDPASTDDAGLKAWMEIQRAHVALAQGDHRAAIAGYDRAIEGAGEIPTLQAERIRALLTARRYNEAATAANKLARERPGDLELQFLQAKVAIETGDGDIALASLDKLAAAAPQDPRVSLYRGEVHSMRLAVDDGKAAFAAARALAPDDVDIAIAEAKMLAAAKQRASAMAMLDAAKDTAAEAGRSEQVARVLLTKADLLLAAGERAKALVALDQVIAAQPGNNTAQLRRGILRIEDGNTDSGRDDLVAVFDRTGGFPGLAAPLGRLYASAQDYDALERLVGDRLRGAETSEDLLVIGTRLRLHQGRTADARTLVNAALAARPTDWETQMLAAQVLIAEARPAEALAQIEAARPPTPQAELMLQRGKIFEFNARHDDAMPEYRQALELQPDLHEARFLYGRLLGFGGANGKALVELQRVAAAESAKSAAWYPEVWLRIGRAQQGLGKSEAAIASLNKATELQPGFGEAFAKQGQIHVFLNQHAKAIAALTKAKELGSAADNWYPGALMNLGRAQAKAGKNAAAKETLGEFLGVASPEDAARAEAERLIREL